VKVNNKTFINERFGKKVKYFDVASVTKIMVTTPLCMKLYEENALNLDKSVSYYLSCFRDVPVGNIKLRDLLRHRSGLVAWRPFFKKVHSSSELMAEIMNEKLGRKSTAIYSDLDFIILGWILEEILEMPLDEAAKVYLFSPLKMNNTLFKPLDKIKNLKQFAPTRNRKPRGLIQGEVFDDNTWCVGGVSGQAGLFSTAEDVTKLGTYYLDLYNNKSCGVLRPPTLKYFVKRAIPRSVGDWGLGFTLPSRPISTAGTKVSDHAFGHVGFTGTSLWIDPKRQAVVTVLSNGTYPDGSNLHFKTMRRELHDEIWGMIDES